MGLTRNQILYGLIMPAIIILWGTEYTLVGYIGDAIPETWQVAIRLIFASLLMTGFVYAKGGKLPSFKNKAWLWFGIMGFTGMTAPYYLIAKGYNAGVNTGLLSILIGVTPLITVVLAHFFVKSEPLNKLRSLGFVIGFIGTVLLFLPKDWSWALVENWQAQAMVLIGALGYGMTSVLGKLAPDIPATSASAIMMSGAALFAIIAAANTGVPEVAFGTGPIIALIALTIGATAMGNFLYISVLQMSGPGLAAKINYIVPFVAILAGIIFLKENFEWRYMLALGVILAGLLIARLGEAKASDP